VQGVVFAARATRRPKAPLLRLSARCEWDVVGLPPRPSWKMKPVYTVSMPSDSMSEAPNETLTFRSLELPADAALAVQFSEDAFVCSFGSAERFWAEAGRDGRKWVARLGEKLGQDPRNAVNAWLEGDIVGQVVLGSSETEPDAGHVNLYYLVPSCRGRGLASQLDSYAVGVLRTQG
jgi:hypothetical protein